MDDLEGKMIHFKMVKYLYELELNVHNCTLTL